MPPLAGRRLRLEFLEDRRLPAGPPAAGGVGADPPDSTTPARTAERPGPTPTPVSAGAESPAVTAPDESPAVTAPDPPLTSPASALARWVDDLAVRVDLPAGWDEAAARLLDGLAAAADDSSDPES